MALTSWTIFEYEYSLVEFILSFVLVLFFGYFLVIALVSSQPNNTVKLDLFIAALILAVLWTYSRAHGLFSATEKKKTK